MSLSRTVSDINGDFSRNLQTFLTPVFSDPAKGVPIKFCIRQLSLKTRMMPLADTQKVWPYVHSFRHDTAIVRTDKQTDRRTDGIAKKQYRAVNNNNLTHKINTYATPSGKHRRHDL